MLVFCVVEGSSGNTLIPKITHMLMCFHKTTLAVTVMGFFQSAGRLIKWKSLYGYLIGRHTFYSFASPFPTAAPSRC